MRGEPRSIRTTQSRDSVPPSYLGLPDLEPVPLRGLATMTVRGFLDRVKDASPIAMRTVPLGSSAYALIRAR